MPIFVKILTKAIRQSNENFATAIQQMSSPFCRLLNICMRAGNTISHFDCRITFFLENTRLQLDRNRKQKKILQNFSNSMEIKGKTTKDNIVYGKHYFQFQKYWNNSYNIFEIFALVFWQVFLNVICQIISNVLSFFGVTWVNRIRLIYSIIFICLYFLPIYVIVLLIFTIM